jgi:DMSO/TMAO reductase YedYZ molybdopterin-dependent catalytic subunit
MGCSSTTNPRSRREILKSGLAAAGLGLLRVPDWALPALAQAETLVPFVDIPANFNPTPSATLRVLDIRRIDGPLTPRDQFFTTQHLGQPTVDAAAYRLKVTGLVEHPRTLTLEQLRALSASELVAGFECSGNNRARVQGMVSNGRWTGVPLGKLLEDAGLKPAGREIVFFGADHRADDVEWRGQKFNVDQQFGRSLTREEALAPDVFLAYGLNGEPLTVHQGFPLRLIVPGWYGVANVKWLTQIHVQEDRYLGNYEARWYRTLKGETIDGELKWVETAVTRMHLKSVIARVSREGDIYRVLGFALNDGTPLDSVEVKVDDGPWRPAVMEASNSKYSWKLFTYSWKAPTPGEHTLVSRATDIYGTVQPDEGALANKKSFLEDNGQFPRRVMIS